MRLVTVVALASVLLAPTAARRPGPQAAEPFVAVAVWYPSRPATESDASAGAISGAERARWERDLTAIKAAGFNAIRTPAEWADAEPVRGEYRFDRLAALLTLAQDAGLKAILQIDAHIGPAWLKRRYPDSSVVPPPNVRGAPAGGYCMDHPGVRADLGAFIGAATAAASRSPAFYAIDVWRNPGASSDSAVEFCYCRFTQARFREALQRRYRTLGALNASWGRTFASWPEVHAPRRLDSTAASADWQQFFAAKLQEDLQFRSDASAARGARAVTSHADALVSGRANPWLMTPVVDHYGAAIVVPAAVRPARVLASLDLLRSAAKDKTWWLGALSTGHGGDAHANVPQTTANSGRDLRLWAWAAISRGAGSLSLDGRTGRVGAVRDTLPAELRAASEMAGVITRNSALFAGLRPHAARVAIVQDRNDGDSRLRFYEALFAADIQVDFVQPDELVAGLSTRYDILYASASVDALAAVGQALTAYVTAGGTLIMEASGPPPPAGLEAALGSTATLWSEPTQTAAKTGVAEHADAPAVRTSTSRARVAAVGAGRLVVLRPALSNLRFDSSDRARLVRSVVAAAGVTPEVALDVTDGTVDARFIESADAIMLVALNYGAAPQKVTFAFAPDVPEAIWQNMETGAAVNFRQSADGPTYTRTLDARDVMVLVRGKRLR
ncbi:MAG: beta-galactosidase [Acidobacteriota bacterium]|jgi:beta-galactosidase